MFKRVILEEWASLVPMLAFAALAAVFIATTIRALMMKSGERERMAQLPLSDESSQAKAPETSDES